MKSAMVVATAVALVALFAGVAFAAPVLQPGQTSAPGMSGTCTDCHTYAKPAAPTPSHPYTAKSSYKVKVAFNAYGYIPPSLCNTTTATGTVIVQKLVGKKWVAAPKSSKAATLTVGGKFAGKLNYSASMKFAKKATYRLRFRLVYTDTATSTTKTSYSAWKKVTIHK